MKSLPELFTFVAVPIVNTDDVGVVTQAVDELDDPLVLFNVILFVAPKDAW
jgi:hypothetical protein